MGSFQFVTYCHLFVLEGFAKPSFSELQSSWIKTETSFPALHESLAYLYHFTKNHSFHLMYYRYKSTLRCSFKKSISNICLQTNLRLKF